MWIIKIAILATGIAVTALSAGSSGAPPVNELAQAQTSNLAHE